MPVSRIDKINSELKKEIYTVITRKLKNPFITEMFSITEVDASKDLSSAKVYISVFSVNESKKAATLSAIIGDAGKIRHELARSMRLRTVPELHFIEDTSMAYGDKMDKLINSLNIQKQPEKEEEN